MRPINLFLLLAAAGWAVADAQVQAPPQTARQALIEMLLAQSPGAFEKHLPEPARKFSCKETYFFDTDSAGADVFQGRNCQQ